MKECIFDACKHKCFDLIKKYTHMHIASYEYRFVYMKVRNLSLANLAPNFAQF